MNGKKYHTQMTKSHKSSIETYLCENHFYRQNGRKTMQRGKKN